MTAKHLAAKTSRLAALCLASLFAISCTGTYSAGERSSGQTASPLDGTYTVVAIRRASDVAAPMVPQAESAASPLGQVITFQGQQLMMEGIDCESWRIKRTTAKALSIDQDPNLIDLTLPPADSPNSAGDQRIGKTYKISCDGEFFGTALHVDDRVLVMPWANSALNLILERPLTPAQITQYQSQLKSMKFYDGEITGVLDGATLKASRQWYRYRANLPDAQPIPARPAITQNLLDTLGVQTTLDG